MGKIIVFVGGLLLIAVVVYTQFGDVQKDPRNSIENGLAEASIAGVKIASEQAELLRVQLAISDYIAREGHPPNSLESLIPRYFDHVPNDPITKEPFQYVRDGNTFRLGAQVSAQNVVAKVQDKGNEKKGEAGKTEQVSGQPVNLEELVNPNEIKLDDFVYDPSGKRDPFTPFDVSPKHKVDESVPPLERYTLGQLTVSAVLADQDQVMTALVEDAEGRGYTVKLGSRIGNQNGVVATIDKTGISVVETVVDFTGNEEKKATFMKIQPRQAKGKDKQKVREPRKIIKR